MKKSQVVSPESVRAKITNLAKKLGRDFNTLALEFALERLVVRLRSDPKLAKALVFKGGFVMLKAYGSSRLTVDVDTSLYGLSIEEAEARAKAVIEKDWQDGLWMGAVESEKMEHQTEYNGLRLTARYTFGEPKVAHNRLGKLVLDIGIADAMTPGPQDSVLEPLLGGDPISWRIYPVESIVAEKLHALVSHGSLNSRFKDVYDLTHLLPKCKNLATLRRAIRESFKSRETEVPNSFSEFWKTLDKDVLRRSIGSVSMAVGETPDFDQLERTLSKLLKRLEPKNVKRR
jgi:predicted nucleotidyltransferase component of viral defense system